MAAVLVQPQEPLGGRAHHPDLAQVEIGGKRRRIRPPETGIELERRLGERRLESLREIGLEDVARDDVVAYASHRVEVAPVRERRAQPERLGALRPEHGVGRRLVGRARATGDTGGGWRVGPRSRSRTMASRSRARASRAAPVSGSPVEIDPGRAEPVVPRDHPVVQAEDHVGNREIVVARRREPLQRRPVVVAHVSGAPPWNGGNPDTGATAKGASISRTASRGSELDRRPPERRPTDLGLAALAPDDAGRVRGEKGISAELMRVRGVKRPGRAVQEHQSREIQEASHDLDRVSGLAQVVHQRHPGVGHRAFPRRGGSSARRRRCVSLTCSDRVSSGGVRYPQRSAPSWRYVLPSVMASLARASSFRDRTRGSPRPRRAARRSPECRCRGRRSRC